MARSFTIEEGRTPPRMPLLMSATLKALGDLGSSGTNQEIEARVIENEGVTEKEQDIMLWGGKKKKLDHYLRWARTYLKRRGLVENPSRGVWALTKESKNLAPDNMSSLEEIHNKAEATQESEQADEAVPDDDSWRENLLTTLKGMDPSAFERLAQRLLRQAGFIDVKVTGKAGDGGIDGIGILRVNLISFRTVFQCKRWQGSVGPSAIRDFRGGLQGRADKGLFITTSTFTYDAQKEAVRAGATAIDLIDGEQLCELLKEHELGVKMVVGIDQEFFDSI